MIHAAHYWGSRGLLPSLHDFMALVTQKNNKKNTNKSFLSSFKGETKFLHQNLGKITQAQCQIHF